MNLSAWQLAATADPPVLGIKAGEMFVLRRDHPFFEGHFEGNPILPGVVQLAWFQEIALGGPSPCVIRNAKFRAEVRGGDRLQIECETLGSGERRVRLMRGETVCSEALLVAPISPSP